MELFQGNYIEGTISRELCSWNHFQGTKLRGNSIEGTFSRELYPRDLFPENYSGYLRTWTCFLTKSWKGRREPLKPGGGLLESSRRRSTRTSTAWTPLVMSGSSEAISRISGHVRQRKEER
jgi:hypothetical protein